MHIDMAAPLAALTAADIEQLDLPMVVPPAAAPPRAYGIWNLPDFVPSQGLRRMGSLRITWAENDTTWRLTACQRLLLEDCDRYRGEYVQEIDAICERDALRSLLHWTTTTRFLDEADRECMPAWDEHGAIEGSVAHLTRDGHPQNLDGAGPWLVDVGLLAILGAIGTDGAATCTTVDLDGLVHPAQFLVDAVAPDPTKHHGPLRRVVRLGGGEHPWTYWVDRHGRTLAANTIQTLYLADEAAEAELDARRAERVYWSRAEPEGTA